MKLKRDGEGMRLLKAGIKKYCQRDTYDQYMDGSNWRARGSSLLLSPFDRRDLSISLSAGQFLFDFESIIIPALQAEGGAVPEATLLFSALRAPPLPASPHRFRLPNSAVRR